MKSSQAIQLHALCAIILVVLPVAAWNMIRASVRIWLQGLPWRPNLWNAFVRALMQHTKPLQLQTLLPSSLQTYRAWIQKHGAKRKYSECIETTNGGTARLLWLRLEKTCSKVILFFHGGGYVMPLSNGHLDWMADIQGYLAEHGLSNSIAILEYDLVPGSKYPTQLGQAIDALETIVKSGFDMNNIILGGDSAGGHLALSLISHLIHPRISKASPRSYLEGSSEMVAPLVFTKRQLQRIPVVFLVSPLLSLDTNPANVSSYAHRYSVDCLSGTIVRDYGDYLLASTSAMEEQNNGFGWSMPLDIRNEQGDDPIRTWWKGIDRVVSRVIITAGVEEGFRNHVVKFFKVLKDVTKSSRDFESRLFVQPGEAHDGPLMDFAAGRGSGRTNQVIKSFLVEALSPPSHSRGLDCM